ncbi:hypothetical protein LZ009_05400 [Ramlibacter sp. XY19]|uniref:hypothetical protein n=1 Tax=Ramlibacter paludis TaxID=2908000 RepID=UPI0023D9FB7F|nr:hypothetical protein [Ramlibacter paludis]MCG2592212.1 hypothetical protein [Ramlibacter paludis]
MMIEIDPGSAMRICADIVHDVAETRGFKAILYAGGIETAFEGHVCRVLDRWLEQHGNDRYRETVIVPRHKREGPTADLALCRLPNSDEFRLHVGALIEVKGNYASQLLDLSFTGATGTPRKRRQLPVVVQAGIQASQYARMRATADGIPPAYVVHILVKGSGPRPPAGAPKDSGARHFRPEIDFGTAIQRMALQAHDEQQFATAIQAIGHHHGAELACYLFKVAAPEVCQELATQYPA